VAHEPIDMDDTVGGRYSTTYTSLIEVDHYHADHRNFNTAWTNANDTDKTRAILWAMALIETRIKWKGIKASSLQALEWPRYYAYDNNGYLYGYNYHTNEYIIPEILKFAVAELAYLLIVSDRTAEPSSKGLKGLTVDVIKLEFDASDVTETIPESVMGLINGLGTYNGPGASTVSLVRV